MAQLGPRLSKYIKQQMDKGRDFVDAIRDQAAIEIHAADQADAHKAFNNAPTSQYLENHMRAAVKNGTRGDQFSSQEEFLNAIRDPAYKVNSEYRRAVAILANATPAEVLGVSGHVKDSLGQTVRVGRDGFSEAATPDSMLREAYRDMIREKMENIDRSTATGRYEYMKMLTDPANAEVIAEIEGMLVSPEQRRRHELLAAQAENGGVLRAEIMPTLTGPTGDLNVGDEGYDEALKNSGGNS